MNQIVIAQNVLSTITRTLEDIKSSIVLRFVFSKAMPSTDVLQEAKTELSDFDQLLADLRSDKEFNEHFQSAVKEIGAEHFSSEKSLRSLRMSKGLTQTDAAKLLETSQSNIARIENSTSLDIKAITVIKLADLYDVSEQEIIDILKSNENV